MLTNDESRDCRTPRSRLLQWPGAVATIALAQLLGTSLWFSANGAADDLVQAWGLTETDIGWLTGAVQLGFISGTLAIAVGGVADAFRASRIFVLCSVAGAVFNTCFALFSEGMTSALILRFLVGVSLAGIYPIGMKLIVSWAPERVGFGLAQLAGMLVLGTALPHGLRAIGSGLPWQYVILASSVLALAGAWLIHSLGDGPHLPSGRNRAGARQTVYSGPIVFAAFRIARFRAAAWGYFGHMWELYAFWTLLPLLIMRTALDARYTQLGVSGLAFLVIAAGAGGCLIGGLLSRRLGSEKVALGALSASLCCALMFVLFWRSLPAGVLLLLVLVWGATVVADSPQFSAMSAKACPQELVGAALAMQNSIGFAITVVSISLTMSLFEHVGIDAVWLLLPGPVLGILGFVWALRGADKR